MLVGGDETLVRKVVRLLGVGVVVGDDDVGELELGAVALEEVVEVEGRN